MKTKPYSANKAKLFVTDFFFSNEPYLHLSKKGSCNVCGETWV